MADCRRSAISYIHVVVATCFLGAAVLSVLAGGTALADTAVSLQGDYTPAWVGDDQVYFLRAGNGAQRVYSRSLVDGRERPVSPSSYKVVRFWVLPDKSLLFLGPVQNATKPPYYLFRVRSGRVERMLSQDVSLLTDLHWSPDGSNLLLTLNGRLRQYSVSGAVLISMPITDAVRVTEGRWSPDGDRIAFLAYWDPGPGSDYPGHLYVGNVRLEAPLIALSSTFEREAEPGGALLRDTDEYEDGFDWSSDGQRIIYQRDNRITADVRLWLADLRAMSVTNLGVHGLDPKWGRDGNTVFFLSTNADLYRLNLTDGKVRMVTRGPVAEFEVSPSGKYVAVEFRDAAYKGSVAIVKVN